MRANERDEIVARLQRRLVGGSELPVTEGEVHGVLERLVSAGACRFGVCADRPEQTGFEACELAPPLARMIDHTALKAETTAEQVRDLCRDALRYCFASVCINGCYVPLAAGMLRGSPVAVCTVIGFPLGASASAVKAEEARVAIRQGADEVDMVLNVGYLKSGLHDEVEEDIRAVVRAAAEAPGRTSGRRVLVKVILETALLSDEEKIVACVLSQNARADFVKTSTGFSTAGATAHDVALMKRVVGERMGVKASGGVRSREDAETMVAHGASRIGASASIEILKGLVATGTY
jgi:deoxyribose-phosphate aldolase